MDYFLIDTRSNEAQRERLRNALAQMQAAGLDSQHPAVKLVQGVELAYGGMSYLTPYPVDYTELREFVQRVSKKDWKPANNHAVVMTPTQIEHSLDGIEKAEVVLPVPVQKKAFAPPSKPTKLSKFTPPVAEENIDLLPRKELIRLAWGLGYQESDTRGKAVKELRAMISAKRQAPTSPAAPPHVAKPPTAVLKTHIKRAFSPPTRP